MHKPGVNCTAFQSRRQRYIFDAESTSVTQCYSGKVWVSEFKSGYCPIKFVNLKKGNDHSLQNEAAVLFSSFKHLYVLSIRDCSQQPYFALFLYIELLRVGSEDATGVGSVRSCQRLLASLVQRVSADSKLDPVPSPRAEIPLQELVKTTVSWLYPCRLWRSMEEQISTVDPYWSSLPEELRGMEKTHIGKVHEEIQLGRRIHTGEVCGELSSELSPWWDPMPEQGKSMRRKEWQRQNLMNRLQSSFPIPLCWSRGQDRKIRFKLNLRRQKGGNEFLDLSLFLIILLSQEFLNWICFVHVSN